MLSALALSGLLGFSTLTANATEGVETNAVSNETLRSYLQLQEQLHATQMALERNRQESEALAARNAEAVAARFKAIEEALTAKRITELENMKEAMGTLKSSMESNNRMLMTVAGTIASVGFLVLLLTAYLQWRSVSRLAEFTAMVQSARTALPPGTADAPLLGAGEVTQSGGRLSSVLAQLEKRILELEHTTHPALEARTITAGTQAAAALPPNGASGDNGHDEPAEHDSVLLAKGQSLLSMDKPAEALECFEEILKAEPNHAEALVKKGIALEELRRMDEALQCYDRAIAANGDLTIAYLQKGGLFNRLERYEEALQCYEQALHAQEKAHAS
ncbi:MAG TPA: tetratricopeptide repeat protein [Verrucomicrobiae bacterium]|nr:tetratricopeptide repeat protein [Verrucomicrobiae bacterium]